MNRRLIVGGIAALFLGAVITAGVLMLRGPGGSGASDGDGARVGSFRPATPAGRATGQSVAMDSVAEPTAQEMDDIPPFRPTPPPEGLYGPDYWLEIDFFDDPEQLALLVKELGGIADLYAVAPTDVRMQLVEYLAFMDQLREHLPAILPIELDSDTRSDILMKIVPKDFFNVDVDGVPDLDQELVDLLDQPTPTPIDEDEWLTRLELARLVDDNVALRWARDAKAVFPNSPTVQLHASATLLQLAGGGTNVSQTEIQQARTYLSDRIRAEDWTQTSPSERVKAYHGLYWSGDAASAAAVYEAALAVEPDGQPRRVLEQLLERIRPS
jgi:hypothetical protein